MNKLQYTQELAARLGKTSFETEQIVNSAIRLIYEIVRRGEKLNLSGFGQFSVSHRAARVGVNPRPPYPKITIPALNTPKFKAGTAFKEAVKLR